MFIFKVNDVVCFFNGKSKFNGEVLLLDRLRYCFLLSWDAFFCKKQASKQTKMVKDFLNALSNIAMATLKTPC